MDRELEAIATEVKRLLDLIPLIQRQGQKIQDNPRNLNFITEVAFLQRKADDILQAVRRELTSMENTAAETACLVLASIEEPRWTTDVATITPNPSIVMSLPKPTDPEYPEFIRQLPPSCVRPHYPTIQQYCDEALAKAEPLPFAGIGQKGMELKLRVTSKGDL